MRMPNFEVELSNGRSVVLFSETDIFRRDVLAEGEALELMRAQAVDAQELQVAGNRPAGATGRLTVVGGESSDDVLLLARRAAGPAGSASALCVWRLNGAELFPESSLELAPGIRILPAAGTPNIEFGDGWVSAQIEDGLVIADSAVFAAVRNHEPPHDWALSHTRLL